MNKVYLMGALVLTTHAYSQHSNELYNDGALIHVQAGAEVHVWGDVHMTGATGDLENDGLIKVQGNSYSDNLFQQSGTGTYRVENSDVNVAERQFIEGSYAVRGGQAQIGVNDGSFYNLELANSQGIVFLDGTGNVADVRGSVDFNAGTTFNRIITHDVGISGIVASPANGSMYDAVFGVMNTTTGLGPLANNTVTANGNMSGVDAGYVQGQFRRAISPAGGTYNFVLGLEPAGAGAQRGLQYALLNLAANNYDVITGYFETGSPNGGLPTTECSGNMIDYFGGTDHGEWVFNDVTGAGAGVYTVQVWPQDDNLIASPVWVITKDDAFSGTANDCGPSPVGLSRSGFNGFSEFGVAAPTSALPIELINIAAVGVENHIEVEWNVASEYNVSHYELERSEDGQNFELVATLDAEGTTTIQQTYSFDDFNVRAFQNYYYQVKNVDFDGSYDYTPVVVANISDYGIGFNDNAVALYPNPTNSNTAMAIHAEQEMRIDMKVMTASGKIVALQQLFIGKGNTVFNLSSHDWANGIYFVELHDEISGNKVVKRLIKN